VVCKICGTKIKGEETVCPRCLANMDSDEVVVKSDSCQYAKGNWAVQNGHGILTNKRLIVLKDGQAMAVGGGLVGALIGGAVSKGGSLVFNVSLDEVHSVTEERLMARKALVVYTKDGNSFKILSNLGFGYKEWQEALNSIVN
jgi:hypothetical protein